MCRRHAGPGVSGKAEVLVTLTSRTRQLSLRLLPLPSSHVFEAPEASPGLFQACPIGHGGLPRGVAPHTHFGHPHLVMSGPWYWELIVSLFPPKGLLALFWEGGVCSHRPPLCYPPPHANSLCPISEFPDLKGHWSLPLFNPKTGTVSTAHPWCRPPPHPDP